MAMDSTLSPPLHLKPVPLLEGTERMPVMVCWHLKRGEEPWVRVSQMRAALPLLATSVVVFSQDSEREFEAPDRQYVEDVSEHSQVEHAVHYCFATESTLYHLDGVMPIRENTAADDDEADLQASGHMWHVLKTHASKLDTRMDPEEFPGSTTLRLVVLFSA